jgi:hypothetical protein
MNDSCGSVQENKTQAVLTALARAQEKRQKLISVIAERVNSLSPICERPKASENITPNKEVGFFGSVVPYIEALQDDNDRLETVADKLSEII